MWRKVLKLSSNPRALLRSILALDDSPHCIALGVSIGIFVGLTPTVGIQTAVILGVVFLTRRFFYFNASAAMAATYISNPFTMLPLYYCWYCLGTWFFPGSMPFEEFREAMQFDGLTGWWEAMRTVGVEVGGPMFLGALLTAPFGVLIAYPTTYFLTKWSRQKSDSEPVEGDCSDERVDDAHSKSQKSEPRTANRPGKSVQSVQNL